MSQLSSDSDREPEIDAIVADYLQRVDRGETVNQQELIANYPSFADELRAFFADELNLGNANVGETTTRGAHPTLRNALRIRCPHCRTPADLAVDSPLEEIICDRCGGQFSLIGDERPGEAGSTVTMLGHFELVERLGVGGFGTVWKARDTELDRAVAIKIPRRRHMSSEEVEKLLREARTAAQLRHPYIVGVHEVGRDGDLVYIVSDLVEGMALDQWLEQQRPTAREAAELCAKIASAVHHAHLGGVIHRDLKPANVIVDAEGQPHLTDFGLARRVVGEVTMTLDGQVLGTPAFMSPEQARGEAHSADRRTDVYSLGVMLFQLLTGELPFRGDMRKMIHQVIHDRPPSPRKLDSSVSKDLETITLKCLEKDASLRYGTAAEVAEELYRYLEGVSLAARPVSWTDRAWRWTARKPLLSLGIALVIVCSVGFSWIAYETNGRYRAESLKSALLNAQEDAILRFADQLRPYARWVHDDLQSLARASSAPKNNVDRQHELHARLALARINDEYMQELAERLLSAEATYVGPIVLVLEPHKQELLEGLWSELHNERVADARRFRAGVALANYDAESVAWTQADHRFLAEELLRQNPGDHVTWFNHVRRINDRLLPHWERMWDTELSQLERIGAARAVAEFAPDDEARVAKMLAVADPSQYEILFPLVASVPAELAKRTLRELARTSSDQDASLTERIQQGRQRAGAGITLLRLGEVNSALRALRTTDDPEAISQFIAGCRARDVPVARLVDGLKLTRDEPAADGFERVDVNQARYALLLAMADYQLDEVSDTDRETLIELVGDWYACHPSAAVRGASGWLLSQWGEHALVKRVDSTPMPYDPDREWFTLAIDVNSPETDASAATAAARLHFTFVVFPAGEYTIGSPDDEPDRLRIERRHAITVSRPFAVLDREITFAELIAFAPDRFGDLLAKANAEGFSWELGHPAVDINWNQAVDFCRWLSTQAGFADAQQAYVVLPASDLDEAKSQVSLSPEQPGFRLPTEAEWEVACRAGMRTPYAFGSDAGLLGRYAWYQENSAKQLHLPKTRRPNLRGLFNLHGNVAEWCHDWIGEYPLGSLVDPQGPSEGGRRVVRGGHWDSDEMVCRSAARGGLPPSNAYGAIGFRIALTPWQPDRKRSEAADTARKVPHAGSPRVE